MNPSFLSSLVKRLRAVAHPDASRDWLILVALSLIVLACIVVWNVWAFDTVAKGGSIGAAAPKGLTPFNHESLGTINRIFESREEEEAKYRTGVYGYPDPSQ